MLRYILAALLIFSNISGQQDDPIAINEKFVEQIRKKTDYKKLKDLLKKVKNRREKEKIKVLKEK